jgi:hypothetical protein
VLLPPPPPPLTSLHMRLMRRSFANRFLNQRPKILHFSGRAVGGTGALSGSDAAAVDAGIQLADGVLAARDFAALDLSRCIVVVLSCSWVSVEDLCGLPALVSGLMAAGAWAVVASTSNIPALARKDFLETLYVKEKLFIRRLLIFFTLIVSCAVNSYREILTGACTISIHQHISRRFRENFAAQRLGH